LAVAVAFPFGVNLQVLVPLPADEQAPDHTTLRPPGLLTLIAVPVQTTHRPRRPRTIDASIRADLGTGLPISEVTSADEDASGRRNLRQRNHDWFAEKTDQATPA
jgi:hypothetical protein